MDNKQLKRGILFGLGAAFIWSIWPIASRYAVQQSLNAYDVVALRYLTAGLIFIPIALRYELKQVNWWHALLLALTVGAPHVLAAAIGVFYAPAGHAGVLIPGAMLVIATLGAWWLFRERPDRQQAIGLGAILAGLVLTGIAAFNGIDSQILLGDLSFVISGVLWGIYTLLFRHSRMDAILATALVSIISLLLYTPAYLLSGVSQLATASWQEILFQMFFQGIVSAVLALLLYTKAVAYLGAMRGALFTVIQPGMTILLALPFLGEIPTLSEVMGMLALSLGMIWALGFRRKKQTAASAISS